MANNTYDDFRKTVESDGLGTLPRWSKLDSTSQQHCFRVLRRLAVARALDGGDSFSAIEVEAGLGEDAALRTFLLASAVKIAAESAPLAAERDPIGTAIDLQVPARTLDDLLDSCWVYQDEEIVAWTPLHAVGAGFDREDDEDRARLTAARRDWDEASIQDKVDRIGTTIGALMDQYAHGGGRPAGSSRQIFADQDTRRALATAANSDRFSLLSDGAFEAVGGDVHTVGGVDVKLDDKEAYVRRTQVDGEDFVAWNAELAAWRPDGGDGETAFAWGAGLAMVVSGGSVAGWLRRCAEALLVGQIQAQREAA
ncbi:MAG: hypothetical protein GKS06_11645 [Acidobacteria bacterium]|nr:hypothetical protein [Acidobacteriota bacterium]